MWDSIKVCLGLVQVTVPLAYLMLINYFKDVRDWIRQSSKHEFCLFICYLQSFDAVLRNNMCVKRNHPWSGTGFTCYVCR